LLKIEGAEQIVKDEMLRSPQIQQIFSQTERLGVKILSINTQTPRERALKKSSLLKKT
jgi:hypothetical protein